MGKQSSTPSRDEILRKMCDIAQVRVNDAVRLAYLTGEQTDELADLDLTALTEFKRSPSGAVEIKLADRLAVLEKVLELLNADNQSQGEQFLQAFMEQGQGGG